MARHAVQLLIRFILILGSVLGSLAVCVVASAQSPSGEIRGTVSDPSGAVVPSAAVVLNGPDGASKSTTTGRDGAFHFAAMAPGRYTLVITATGFAPTTVDDVEVSSGKTAQQIVTLQLPVEQQQVEVTDNALGVSTSPDNNTSAIVIKGKDLDAL